MADSLLLPNTPPNVMLKIVRERNRLGAPIEQTLKRPRMAPRMAPGPRMAPRMVEPGFVGHTFEECDQMFRRQATEDNDEVEVLPELVDTSDDDVQLPDLEEVF